jgi:molybdopterin molybdotransferase
MPMAAEPKRAGLMSLEAALDTLLAAARPLRVDQTEPVSTFDALGRVLASDIVSPIDVPPADNTSMDGYAVRCADIPAEGTALPVSQRIPAGTAPQPLVPGSAARIFTGAFVPEGADAIVMQEQCEALDDGRVRIGIVPRSAQWIRRRGEDVTRGAVVLPAGTVLTPQALGMAAGVGRAKVDVRRRVRVALLSTGDELVMPGDVEPDRLPFGAIYNSNRFTLRGLLVACGCEVADLGIVPDRLDATIERLREAGQHHDLIISTGGVSVGEEDHVRPALAAVGHVDLWQLSIKPGKPLAFGGVRRDDGAAGEALFLGLPGNPVSSFVTFLLAAVPVIRTLQGAVHARPKPLPMRADFDWPRPDAKRREFVRVRRSDTGGLDLFSNQSSGVLTSAVWGDGLADLEAGKIVKRGDVLPFLPWSAFGI